MRTGPRGGAMCATALPERRCIQALDKKKEGMPRSKEAGRLR